MLNFIEKIKIIKNKRWLVITTFIMLVILIVAFDSTYSAFRKTLINNAANIKVAGMNYNIKINGVDNRIITAPGNKETKANIILSSLNNNDSKYELIYKICSDASCTNYIDKPANLTIERSSRTIDPISGAIASSAVKQIRIVVTNNNTGTYYIKLDINAGYAHNTLALQNLISTEYNEEDVTIAAIIDGEISTTFPTTSDFITTVECKTNNGASNATGTATWNGTKWVVHVTGVDSGRTVCNVYFEMPAPIGWRTSSYGTLLYSLKSSNALETPLTHPGRQFSLSNEALMAKTTDDYGISYYFRGAVENNYIIFGNMCWRIVRVIGNGAIKLALYNYNPNSLSNPCNEKNYSYAFARYNGEIYKTPFNPSYAYNAYVGFMYGSAGNYSSYAQEHANITKSTILNNLETWYRSKLSSYESQLADVIWCNDKKMDTLFPASNQLGYYTSQTSYGPRGRIYASTNYMTHANPSLVCPDDSNGGKLSKFTVYDTQNGNGNLNYKIGLLTADEVAFSGSAYSNFNYVGESTFYLVHNSHETWWWTLSPGLFDSIYAMNTAAHQSGNYIFFNTVSNEAGLRPAIALVSTVSVIGSGTAIDPYVVIN